RAATVCPLAPSWRRPRHPCRRKLDRLEHARIAAAAAEMPVHGLADFALAWLGIGREKLRALDGHTVEARAALDRLEVDEGPLQRMELGRRRNPFLFGVERGQPFERGDGLAHDLR